MEDKKGKRLQKLADGLLRSGKLWRGRPAMRTVRYTVRHQKIQAPVTLAVITDLHSCYYGVQMEELVGAIIEAEPQAILLGGDIFDDVLPPENAECLIQQLAVQYPCYYVCGNHEERSGKLDVYKAWLKKQGVRVLEGNSHTAYFDKQAICFCGVDDPRVHGEPEMHRQLENLAVQTDASLYRILLSHRPEKAQRYMDNGFDLAVCGHAHGGQWRIPGLVNGIYAPGQGIFPKLAGGRYDYAAGSVIVSRGLARETTWVPRIGNRPELVVINLAEQMKG